LDTITTAPIFALLGVGLTVITNYLIQRKKSQSDTLSTEREVLSKDQQDFKLSILLQLKECKDSVDKIHKENEQLHEKLLETQEKKLLLVEEIIGLKQEINILRERIRGLENSNSEKIKHETGSETQP
jgi:uncharacterized coiled-coil DUF342 family protein